MSIISLSIDSPVSPATSVTPLVFVIFVTTVKQGYEDYLRHRSDKEVNNSLVTVVRNGCPQQIKSQLVRVGDLVVVRKDEDVPCDLVLLASSDPEGRCFVTTANLDGETNLKTLFCPRLLRFFSQPEQLARLRAQVECEHPNPDLYRFHGKIEVFPDDDNLYASLLGPEIEDSPDLAFQDKEETGGKEVHPTAVTSKVDVENSTQEEAQDMTKINTTESSLADQSHMLIDIPANGHAVRNNDTISNVENGLLMNVLRETTSSEQASKHRHTFVSEDTAFCNLETAPVRHSLAFGETVTHGRRSLKRIGLLLDSGMKDMPKTTSRPSMRSVRLSQVSNTGAVPVRRCSLGVSAPLGSENLLLRGTRLRNTDCIYGCAVYTGQQTKLALNSKLTSNKFSTVEKSVNKFLIFFLVILLLEVTISLILKYTWQAKNLKGHDYMGDPPPVSTKTVIIDLLSFFILYNYIIPISLYVTIEMQKFLGSFFFEWDLQLYDKATDQAAICNTSDLNEELGQVQVLFTDKTGTLTENDMQFQCCSVAGIAYAEREGRIFQLQPNMNDISEVALETLPPELDHFFLALALCHSVQLGSPAANNNYSPGQALDYQASSPDEKALVEAAARCGVVFLGEEGDFMSVLHKGVVRRFRKLDILEFTSERKRMSIVVEDEDGKILLYCKGAESSVLPLSDDGPLHKTHEHINDFSIRGLRTLTVGYRILDRANYYAQGQAIEVARQTVSAARDSLVSASYEQLERGLYVLGATGVEDRLQDGVQETLESLRAAGIKIWILTGDKTETALNISLSCGHFKSGTDQLFLTDHKNEDECLQSLQNLRDQVMEDKHKQYGLVVDGQSLHFALLHPNIFRDICKVCTAVICCRMSPLQKCEVVQLVKNSPGKPVTAAIGDGANDVSMIQEAHVGLGVMGREGRQAVRCSDFAIARFKFLRRVLLVHGHWYYERISTLVQYFFYKNIVFITPQLYYGFYNGFSTQALYNSLFLTIYNVFVTSLPVLIYGLTEQEYSDKILLDYPQLYRSISNNLYMQWKYFAKWNLFGLWHSFMVFFLPVLMLEINSVFYYNCHPADGSMLGTLVFHSVVVVANIKLLLHSRYWTAIFVFSIAISVFGFMALALAYSSIHSDLIDVNMYLLYNHLLMSPSFWLLSLLIFIACLVPDVTFASFSLYCNRKNLKKMFQWLRYRRRGHLTISDSNLVFR